jgi:hypothetical protein
MGGVTNEIHLEANVMGEQVDVEDVVPLVPSEIIEKQVEMSEDVGRNI